MKHLRTFESWSKTNEEIFGLFDEEVLVDPKTESKWLAPVGGKTLTYEEIAKKFKVTPEEIADFETYLDGRAVNGVIQVDPSKMGKRTILTEEEYLFQMEANYAAYLEEEDSSL